jgi:ABC-type dipeptide/oligopeptide/nickel transport system permease component
LALLALLLLVAFLPADGAAAAAPTAGTEPSTDVTTPLQVQWSAQATSGTPIANASYALYQGAAQFPVSFGGNTSCGFYCNDTLEFLDSGGEQFWYDVAPSHSPPPRANGSMVWDPTLHGLLLFGGIGPHGLLNDSWLFQRTVGWTELHPARAPPARELASFAYDPVDGEAILFGGEGASGVALGDTWAYGAQGWVELHPASAPSPRFGAGLVYDQGAGRLYLFGGEGTGGFLSDTWWFRGGVWFPVPTAQSPSPRALALLVATGDGTPLLFGGEGATGWLNDTWAFLDGTWQTVSYLYGAGPPALQSAVIVANPTVGTNFFALVGGYDGGAVPQELGWTLSVPFGGVPNGTAPLTATLTGSGSRGSSPLVITFVANVAGGQSPYQYLWSFGDGSTASGSPSEVHEFTRTGTFTTELTVTDGRGVSVMANWTVTVVSPAGPSLLSYFGGPVIWVLGFLALVAAAGIGRYSFLEHRRTARIRAQVGRAPGRLQRTASALHGFSQSPNLSRLARELREVWGPHRGEHPRRGASPFLLWLARRLLLVVPQVLLATTILWFLSVGVPDLTSGSLPAVNFSSWLQFNGELFTGQWGFVSKSVGGFPEAVAPTTTLLAFYLRDSLELGLVALVLATLISYPLGLLSGWRPGRPLDNATRTLAAFGAFFSLVGLVLILTSIVYTPFSQSVGDAPFGTLPSGAWFEVNYGSFPSWVNYLGGTTPTGFPLLDAALGGSWAAMGVILAKLLFQAAIIAAAFSALFLRYARLGTSGQRANFHLVVSRARGVPESRLLWRDTSRLVLPVYLYTFANTFAIFLLIQSLVEWFFNDNGFGAFLIESVYGEVFTSSGPPLIAVLAFLFLMAVLAVNIVADALARVLDPRTAGDGRRG